MGKAQKMVPIFFKDWILMSLKLRFWMEEWECLKSIRGTHVQGLNGKPRLPSVWFSITKTGRTWRMFIPIYPSGVKSSIFWWWKTAIILLVKSCQIQFYEIAICSCPCQICGAKDLSLFLWWIPQWWTIVPNSSDPCSSIHPMSNSWLFPMQRNHM